MKSFTQKALAVAAASLCGSAAFAGSQVVTPTNFAIEAVTNTTAVAVPQILLTLGVARTQTQDYTVVIKPQAGATFNGSTCISALPLNGTNGTTANIVATLKRASTSECAYEIDVNAAGDAAGVVLGFGGLSVASHSLGGGTNLAIGTGVFELGESARIDNSNDLINTVATAAQAVTIVAAQDTGTTADVNHPSGPLFGFVVANDDTADVARASFIIRNNPNSLKTANGTSNFDANLAANMTRLDLTVTGNFNGATVDGNGVVNGIAAVHNSGAATVTTAGSGDTATARFSLLPGNLNTVTQNTTVTVSFTSAKNTSLGTSRTFGVAGTSIPAVGGNQTMAGNSSWWVWRANAIELRSAFFNNDVNAGNLTRFFFQNTGTAAAYSAVCYTDDAAKTVTNGTKVTGTLRTGQTTIDAKDVCTFSAGNRGAITFTINGPAANIKGVYQQAINGAAAGYLPLERPYAGSTY